jgi:uncharacterized protein YndB with AHSA1/START domain
MNEFTIVTVIARPVNEVFAAITDTERMPLWMPGMSEAPVTSDGPLEAGSTLIYREPSWDGVWRCPSSVPA